MLPSCMLEKIFLEVAMIKRHVSPDDRLNPDILQQQIIYLSSELDNYRSKARDYQENYHYNQLEKLKIENSHLLSERQRFTSHLEEMNHKNLTLQNRIMEKDALIERVKKQIENFKEEIGAVSNRLQQAESDNRESLKEVERHKHSSQQLQNQVTSLENELVLRSDQQTQSEEMIQKIQHSNQILSDKNKQLTEETLSYKEEIKKMLDQLNHLQNHITTQEQKLTEQNDIQLKNKAEIQNLQDINERQKEEQTQLKEEKLTLESFQNEMFDKIEDLKKDILSYSSKEMTGSPSQNTKIEYNKLFQQIEQLFSQINEYGEKISTCVSLTNHLEEHIDNLTNEIKQLKSTLSASSTHQQTI